MQHQDRADCAELMKSHAKCKTTNFLFRLVSDGLLYSQYYSFANLYAKTGSVKTFLKINKSLG